MTLNNTNNKTGAALMTNLGVLTQEQGLQILNNLIAKPETDVNNLAQIFTDTVGAFNTMFAPAPVAEAPKKRKRRVLTPGAVIGWPAGVKRDEYKTWKDAQMAAGVTENLNPHAYKAMRDMHTAANTALGAPEGTATPAPAPAAPPEAKKEFIVAEQPKAAPPANRRPSSAAAAESTAAGNSKLAGVNKGAKAAGKK